MSDEPKREKPDGNSLSPRISSPNSRHMLVQAVGMGVVLLLLALLSTVNYLLFHSVVEIFTIVISISIFILIWNGRKYIDNAFFLVVGVGLLCAGGIDILHTLAYKGMGVFSFGGADLPTQLWIAARYLQAFSLLLAPLAIGRKVRFPALLAVFGAVTAAVLAAIFAGVFPHCFIEGVGLTPFKIYSEYAICAILVASAVLLYRERAHFDPDVLSLLLLANAFFIAAELSFTAYVSVFGFANMLGHLLRVVAVYLWYLAFLDIGQKRPFDLLWREMKQNEERLAESEGKYRKLFESMFEGFAYCRMIYDSEGRPADWEYLEVNPAFYRLTGLKDVVGRRVSEAIPGTRRETPELLEVYGRVASSGRPETFDIYFTPLQTWLHIAVSSPEKGYFIAVFEDITEKKESEARLSYLSAIIENSNDAIIGKSLEGVITSWNEGAERIYGYTAREAIGRHISFIAPNGHIEGSLEMIERIRAGEDVVHWDALRRTRDGRLIEVALTSSPIRDPLGDLIGVSTIARDVTEQKAAEEALKTSEKRYRRLFESAKDGILILNRDTGEIIDVNPFLETLLGYSHEEMLGKHLWDIGLFQDVHSSQIAFEELQAKGYVRYEDLPLKAKGGRTIDVEFVSNVYPVDHIKVIQCNIRDITDRKRAETALRKSEERFRSYIENAPDGVFVVDEEGNYLMVNEAACAITGYTRDELQGKNIKDLIFPEDHPRAFEHFQRVREFGVATGESRFVTKGGDVRYWLVKAVRIDDQCILGFAGDITDRKLMEEEIRILNTGLEQKVEERTRALEDANVALEEEIAHREETEKKLRSTLEERTLLLREVHHRVKNNLQIIISLSNLQLRQVDDPAMRHVLAETQNRVRAMALVHEKLYKSESLSDIDLAEYVRFLASQLFAYYETDSRSVVLEADIEKITLPINTAIPLGLIINELVSNALKHAFPPGTKGVISILAGRDDDTIHLTVEDTGVGIPHDLDWRNTRSLGLRLVVSLVNQLDGTIDLDRSTGTRFSMVLKVKQ